MSEKRAHSLTFHFLFDSTRLSLRLRPPLLSLFLLDMFPCPHGVNDDCLQPRASQWCSHSELLWEKNNRQPHPHALFMHRSVATPQSSISFMPLSVLDHPTAKDSVRDEQTRKYKISHILTPYSYTHTPLTTHTNKLHQSLPCTADNK